MTKKMWLLLLIIFLLLIGGLNTANRGVNSVFGSDYPQVIKYDGNKSEGQLQVLGRVYSLAPGVIDLVQKTTSWLEKLSSFLETVEQLVKKYGRQAQEIIRYLPEKSFSFIALS